MGDKTGSVNKNIYDSCNHLIIHGTEMENLFNQMLNDIPMQFYKNSSHDKEEFVKISSYLLFLAPFEAIMTPKKFQELDETINNLTQLIASTHKERQEYQVFQENSLRFPFEKVLKDISYNWKKTRIIHGKKYKKVD